PVHVRRRTVGADAAGGGVRLKGAIEVRQRLARLAAQGEHLAAVAQRPDVLGVDAQRLVVVVQGAVVVAARRVGVAAVVVQRLVARRQAQPLGVVGDGLLVVALLGVR